MIADDDRDTCYVSYMLRMWRKRDSGGQPMVCASLEEPGSHEMTSFRDVDSLVAFLQSRLGLTPQGAGLREERPPESIGRGGD